MEKILILDGGLGTQIQAAGINTGCNDYLCVTNPEVIAKIHNDYLVAGADIISTNSFNANEISLAEYGLQDKVYQINYQAAKIAKNEAVKFNALVAGSVGVSSKALSMAPDVENPAARDVTFDQMAETFAVQIKGLIDGGADMILIETVFDTLNAKAAVFALRNILSMREFPLAISGTITDASGRILSGQTVEAFYYSLQHANMTSIGLNCAFGAKQIKPYVERLKKIATCKVSAHPNAGLPNLFGGYDETPEEMAKVVETFLADGIVDIIGGCCGTTPEYVAQLKKIRDKYAPKPSVEKCQYMTLAGLDEVVFDPQNNFVNVGERTNVAGSAKFARLIRERKFDEAIQIARNQIVGGAQVIDVCMDDAMIDASEAMCTFINLIAGEPDIARVPIMIDSSHWEVIVDALKCVQGRAVVNSISLKEGEEEFVKKARFINDMGAAMVVMLFDEKGQADTYQRKIEIAKRAYNILINSGIGGENIIFDPNILAVATGIKEHDLYAVDFIEATKWIKKNCPKASVSGGVSNLSFSFRGNNVVREAMHSVFLYHAIKAGMNVGIVNPELLQIYDKIEPKLKNAVENVVLCKGENATEKLIEIAAKSLQSKTLANENVAKVVDQDCKVRVGDALINGSSETIAQDTIMCYEELGSVIEVINKVLMPAMGKVGEMFSQGKMFLPQVVKSARMMKLAVEAIRPFMSESDSKPENRKKIVIATVKGDVHDIGKNIVALVLRCNNYDVEDLGVMVEPEKIVQHAVNADAVVLSGLITPSLEQMCVVAKMLQESGLNVPLAIGGATTSAQYTAVKLAPLYEAIVAHSNDASECANMMHEILYNPEFKKNNCDKQHKIRLHYCDNVVKINSLEEARKNAPKQN